MTKSDIKSAIAHANRMSQRNDYRVDFNEIDDYAFKSINHARLTTFLFRLVKAFAEDRKYSRIGGVDLPTYFNDTFRPDGKCWYEDLNDGVYKVSIEVRYMGTMHFYIKQNYIINPKDEIVLDLIQAYEPGRELGTYMLNKVLDVADDLGETIVTYPCDIDPATTNYAEARSKTLRLRTWFSAFEFTGHWSTAKMTYKPNK